MADRYIAVAPDTLLAWLSTPPDPTILEVAERVVLEKAKLWARANPWELRKCKTVRAKRNAVRALCFVSRPQVGDYQQEDAVASGPLMSGEASPASRTAKRHMSRKRLCTNARGKERPPAPTVPRQLLQPPPLASDVLSTRVISSASSRPCAWDQEPGQTVPPPSNITIAGPPWPRLAVFEAWVRGCFQWEAVCRILQSEYDLRIEEDDHLCILRADHDSDIWRSGTPMQRLVLAESRGTILEKASGRPVCMPFVKFWNAGEDLACVEQFDWTSATASEKIDGTFLKLFFYRGSWRLASNRRLDVHAHGGKYACTGRSNYELFLEAAARSGLDYARLNPRHTYLLERVHPDFTIVIVPQEPRLYHLATRDMQTLQEVFDDVGLPRPLEWTPVRSLAECRALLDTLPGFREGLVLRDGAGRRMKLKRAEYVLMHMSTNGCSDPDYSWVARSSGSAAARLPIDRLCLAVWLHNEESEFSAYLPEHRARYRMIARVLESRAFREEGWLPTGDPRARSGAEFVHEPRLWSALAMLSV